MYVSYIRPSNTFVREGVCRIHPSLRGARGSKKRSRTPALRYASQIYVTHTSTFCQLLRCQNCLLGYRSTFVQLIGTEANGRAENGFQQENLLEDQPSKA